MTNLNEVIVFDCETTGLSPNLGDRMIELGAVKMRNGKVIERFQQLINPGRPIPRFIEQYTGIRNADLVDAPWAETVIPAFHNFCENIPLVAHNASFDKRFLVAECQRLGLEVHNDIACTVLLSRRLLPNERSYKLSRLVRSLRLPQNGNFHRALADAEMTAELWKRLFVDGPELSITQIMRLMKIPKAKVADWLAQQ